MKNNTAVKNIFMISSVNSNSSFLIENWNPTCRLNEKSDLETDIGFGYPYLFVQLTVHGLIRICVTSCGTVGNGYIYIVAGS